MSRPLFFANVSKFRPLDKGSNAILEAFFRSGARREELFEVTASFQACLDVSCTLLPAQKLAAEALRNERKQVIANAANTNLALSRLMKSAKEEGTSAKLIDLLVFLNAQFGELMEMMMINPNFQEEMFDLAEEKLSKAGAQWGALADRMEEVYEARQK